MPGRMNCFNMKYVRLLIFLFSIAFCVTAYSQQNSTIDGTVVDAQGAALPGAHVSIKENGTGFTSNTESNSSGLFTFPGLNVGTYDLTVTATGFDTYKATGLVVNVSETLRSDVKLTVGSVGTTVTVKADALQVQTDSNVISTLINSEQISEIATENRNFAALAALGMGVSSALPDSNTPTSVAASFTISVNGLRQSHNIWLIDGGEADDRGGAGGMDIMPSQDAIAQFETLASNYPPDYGISSGATISLGLKSGTQHFHGELFEFNRNTVFDANNFLNKQSDPVTPRTKLNYNIFGGNIGGPLFIPHVYNNDRQKTFFFWNEEWRRLVQGSSPTQVNSLAPEDFPTAGADLNYVTPVFEQNALTTQGKSPVVQLTVPNINCGANPSNPFCIALSGTGLTPGQPFPNNRIPHQLIDANAVAYLATGVIPAGTLSNNQALQSANQPITVRDDVLRIDHRITDKWQILGHYLHDSVTQAYSAPMLGWSGASYTTITSTLSNPANSAAIKLTGTITPTLLAEVSMNYDGNIINIINSANAQTPSSVAISKYFNNGSKNLPNMHFNGFYGTQENPGSAPWHNAAEDYDPKVDISWTKGKHAMKYGFGYNRYTKNQQLFGEPGGNFQFSGSQTGDAFMDFLLGLSSNFDQNQALPIRHYVNQTISFYGNDNWHVTPRLSLQLGFRYDALPHAFERANQVANFNPAAYDPSQAPIWNSDGSLDANGPGFKVVGGTPFYLNGISQAGQGIPTGLVKNDYNTYQPRVGFSYDLRGDGRTVIRGGFGTFYERLQGNDIYNAATNEPFSNDPGATNVFFTNPAQSWVSGKTATIPLFAQGLTTLAINYPAPAVGQYSLGIQHELAPSLILITQYVGNTAWNQNVDRDINNFPLSTPLNIRADAGDSGNKFAATNPANPTGNTSLPNSNIYRTYQGYGRINQQENTTSGGYNSFQMGLRAQNKHGLSGEADYTYSHEIDVTTYDLGNLSNPYDTNYDKGSGALDRRHIFNANYIYKLPVFGQANYLTRLAVGGWEVAGTMVFESGTIISNQGPGLSLSYDPVGLGGNYTNRPDRIAKVHYLKKQKEWFDPASFAAPLPAWAGSGTNGFGTAGKDSVLGPGRLNFTTSLYKTFTLKEGINFQFRAESFNTFNHTEFNGLNTNYPSNFGQVSSTYDPRVLELGGKLNF